MVYKYPLMDIKGCKKGFTLLDHVANPITSSSHSHPLMSSIKGCIGFLCTSRHGSKGGRFIDGMYASQHSLASILGIAIIQDAGVLSDHDLIISNIDLGIEHYHPNKEKTERIDFKSIMNIFQLPSIPILTIQC